MITFDNLRLNTTNYTHDLLEGIELICNAVMIDEITGYNDELMMSVVNGSWASASTASEFTQFTGSGLVEIAEVNGATVSYFYLQSNVGVWFGDGESGVGFQITDTQIKFRNYSSVIVQLPVVPDFGEIFKVVYTIELNSNLALVFHAVSVYNGERLLGSCAFEVTDIPEYLLISSTDPATFLALRHSLSRPTTYLTIDVSESPQESLARLISGFDIDYRGRYDGSVIAWRWDNGMNVVADVSEYSNLAPAVSQRIVHQGIITRARVSGALPENEHIDLTNAAKHLLRFMVFQNPEIVSKEDAAIEAERIVSKTLRESHPLILEWHTLPIIEPGDIVLVDGVRYVFAGASYQIGINMYGTATLLKEIP